MRRTEYLSELAYDVRFAVRQLAKARGFAFVAIATLALGIGATSAIFSAVEAVILRPFPFHRPQELVFAFTHWPNGGDGTAAVGDYLDWHRRASSVTNLAAFTFKGVTVAGGDEPDHITVAQTTGNAFQLYGLGPELGRAFGEDANRPGNSEVVVLSDGFWRRMFAADPTVLGRTISLDGEPYTIVGVMPADFDPTDSHEQAWTPIVFTPDERANRDNHSLTVVGRLAPGVTVAAAQREFDIIAKHLAADHPTTNKTIGIHVAPLETTIIGDYERDLYVTLGAVACVLLIACGNVANLLLARGAAREKELAIRAAIGAGRGRILRQLLTESLVLSLLATASGLALAWLMTRFLLRAAPDNIPRLASTRIDGRVVVFALALAGLSTVLFGTLPALRAARGDVHSPLREGSRTALPGARDRVRGMLICIEVAVALMLLIGAGLLIRSEVYLDRVTPGFDPRGVLSARIALRATSTVTDGIAMPQTFERILEKIQHRPGVAAAALTSQVPLSAGGSSNGVIPEGRPLDIANIIDSGMRIVTPGYLGVMRIPVIAGRDVSNEDVRGGVRVVVISQTLARRAWPNENPIGKRLVCCEGLPNDPRWKTVIGVAADVRSNGPARDVRPEFYLPISQAPAEAWSWIGNAMTIVARPANNDPAALTPILRAAVKDVDPTLPVYDVETMDTRWSQSLAESRFHLLLLVALGTVGLLLATAGIYSVIAYFVTLRTHEIGVRMALGATPRDVLRLLAWQGLRPVVAGTVLGAMVSALATRLLSGSIFGVQANDPTTFGAVIGLLLVVAWAATMVPARRATSVDPTTALHG